jgi:hypothetical protein
MRRKAQDKIGDKNGFDVITLAREHQNAPSKGQTEL